MRLDSIAEETAHPFFFRMAYLINHHRDPLIRRIELVHRLTRPELAILGCLVLRDGLSATDIAHLSGQPRNSLSRGAALLEEKGCLEKRRDEDDGRKNRLFLTALGRTRHSQIKPCFLELERRMIHGLSAQDLAQLERLLKLLCRNVEALPDWSASATHG